jgi:predicted metal-dependent phosphoesterase TrpH
LNDLGQVRPRGGWLKGDFHLHTREDAKDSVRYSAKEMIDRASMLGYKVLSITNHNRVTYSEELKDYAYEKGILLLPGVEATIQGKHVLLLGKRDYSMGEIRSIEGLRDTREEGVVIVAPHPFFPSALKGGRGLPGGLLFLQS